MTLDAHTMTHISHFSQLSDRYEGFLFDAYGVLVNEAGAITGAKRLIKALKDAKRPFWILSNGSSRTETEMLEHYAQLGFSLDKEQLIGSGSLLAGYFAKNSYKGAQVAVLGSEGSEEYVRRAGGNPVPWLDDHPIDLMVIANQTGFPLLEGLDKAISIAFKKIDAGESFKIILTNPDLIYPKGQGSFGITAGSLAMILEEALVLRYGEDSRRFLVKLGKPYSPIFDEAVARAKTSSLLMVGDQLLTDIKGARDYGLDSLLVGTGLTPRDYFSKIPHNLQPTYLMNDLRWDTNL